MLVRLLTALITLYQKTLSPDHGWVSALFPGGYCKFTPSCSAYSKTALQKHGAIKGTCLGCKRIFKCRPGTKGGIDLVPDVE